MRRVVGFCLPWIRMIVTLCAAVLFVPALGAQAAGTAFGLAYAGVGIGTVVRLLESDVTLRIGDEIRVARSSAPVVRGTLQRVTGDSLFLRTGDSTTAIPRSDVHRVQRYEGIERKWAQGFSYGFLIGTGTGAVTGFLSGDDPPGFLSFTAPEKALILGIVGGFTGSMVGVVAGSLRTGEHWRGTHPFSEALAFLPTKHGTAIGVTLTF